MPFWVYSDPNHHMDVQRSTLLAETGKGRATGFGEHLCLWNRSAMILSKSHRPKEQAKNNIKCTLLNNTIQKRGPGKERGCAKSFMCSWLESHRSPHLISNGLVTECYHLSYQSQLWSFLMSVPERHESNILDIFRRHFCNLKNPCKNEEFT